MTHSLFTLPLVGLDFQLKFVNKILQSDKVLLIFFSLLYYSIYNITMSLNFTMNYANIHPRVLSFDVVPDM